MAPAYRSLEDDQIIVSDEPRPDLEALSRWEQIADDEASEALAAAEATALDEDVAKLAAFIEEHDLDATEILAILTDAVLDSPDVIETTPGTENQTPINIIGERIGDDETLQAAIVGLPDGTIVGGDGTIPVLTDETPAVPVKKTRAPRKTAEPKGEDQ